MSTRGNRHPNHLRGSSFVAVVVHDGDSALHAVASNAGASQRGTAVFEAVAHAMPARTVTPTQAPRTSVHKQDARASERSTMSTTNTSFNHLLVGHSDTARTRSLLKLELGASRVDFICNLTPAEMVNDLEKGKPVGPYRSLADVITDERADGELRLAAALTTNDPERVAGVLETSLACFFDFASSLMWQELTYPTEGVAQMPASLKIDLLERGFKFRGPGTVLTVADLQDWRPTSGAVNVLGRVNFLEATIDQIEKLEERLSRHQRLQYTGSLLWLFAAAQHATNSTGDPQVAVAFRDRCARTVRHLSTSEGLTEKVREVVAGSNLGLTSQEIADGQWRSPRDVRAVFLMDHPSARDIESLCEEQGFAPLAAEMVLGSSAQTAAFDEFFIECMPELVKQLHMTATDLFLTLADSLILEHHLHRVLQALREGRWVASLVLAQTWVQTNSGPHAGPAWLQDEVVLRAVSEDLLTLRAKSRGWFPSLLHSLQGHDEAANLETNVGTALVRLAGSGKLMVGDLIEVDLRIPDVAAEIVDAVLTADQFTGEATPQQVEHAANILAVMPIEALVLDPTQVPSGSSAVCPALEAAVEQALRLCPHPDAAAALIEVANAIVDVDAPGRPPQFRPSLKGLAQRLQKRAIGK